MLVMLKYEQFITSAVEANRVNDHLFQFLDDFWNYWGNLEEEEGRWEDWIEYANTFDSYFESDPQLWAIEFAKAHEGKPIEWIQNEMAKAAMKLWSRAAEFEWQTRDITKNERQYKRLLQQGAENLNRRVNKLRPRVGLVYLSELERAYPNNWEEDMLDDYKDDPFEERIAFDNPDLSVTQRKICEAVYDLEPTRVPKDPTPRQLSNRSQKARDELAKALGHTVSKKELKSIAEACNIKPKETK
jgi:hypothetical protein